MAKKKTLQVEYVDIGELKPYEKNAKLHPAEQVEQIKNSIREFGMNDPIAVWKDNVIIEGHGRLLACQALGIKKVPIIRLDNLTDKQRRAYTLAHNKLTMNSGFDLDILIPEIEELSSFDMTDFGFEPLIMTENTEDDFDDNYGVAPPMQHNVFENVERAQFAGVGYYDIPMMQPTSTTGDKFLRFCDWHGEDLSEYIGHFYYDDFKFISAWREPDKYIDRLKQFKAVISPDFSLYTDFPRALQILSCYRRQWCGAYWQSLGIDVIPDVVWGDKDSYDWCFDGIPKGGTVAVSAVGVKRDGEWNGKDGELFRAGYDQMMERIQPTAVLYYGDMIDGLEGNIIRIPSFYEQRRDMLNEMSRVKTNGERAQ